MKTLTCTSMLLAIMLLPATGGSEHLIKQRAKDVRDQSNERQGVAPSSSVSTAPQPAAATQPGTVSQAPRSAAPKLSTQAALIGEALGAVSQSGNVTDQQEQELFQYLTQAAQGEVKPSDGKVKKLARDLAIAVEGAKLNSSQQSKLALQLERALNESLDTTKMNALAADVFDMLRDMGSGKVDATIVSNDIKSIIADIQRGGKH